MGKLVAVLYGALCYILFLGTFLYAVGFVADVLVPKSIDSGAFAGYPRTLIIDALLLGLFAVQHSVMARPAFKAWWTRFVPYAIERSTYVLASSLALIVLFAYWQPLPMPIWSVSPGVAADALWALCGIGWATVLTSTFLIDHFDLFGLRQVWTYRREGIVPPAEFRTPLFYRVVRHPLYVGFIIAFWATPSMSQGHLVFAVATTSYILIAIQFEEHDLRTVFGEHYLAYQKRVSMIVPWFAKKPL